MRSPSQTIRAAWGQCLAGYRNKTTIALALCFLLSCTAATIAKATPGSARSGAADEVPIALPDLKIVMVPIPAGSVPLTNMRAPAETRDQQVTQVTLSKFWLGKTEVTQSQYEMLMGENPAYFRGSNLPMDQVSWEDAMAFCHKLTAQERAAGRLPAGFAYILPTEAQWEYACRAGTTGDFAGDVAAMAWFDKNSDATSHPVGTKQPNGWGLHDMHGNIREWCLEWDGDYPGGSVTDYAGPATGTRRVTRGGCWEKPSADSSSSNRGRCAPGGRIDLLGFRIALSSIPEMKFVMLPIPAGSITLTNSKTAELTQVTLSKFWLGETEVTQWQYKSLMGTGAGSPRFQGHDLPMEEVSWESAMTFCRKLTEQERAAGRLPAGYVYTLPTEAQWEYACRAGSAGDDSDNLEEFAWFKKNSDDKSHPVGTKKPNAWGLYDMQGNVRELCLDWLASYPGGSVTNYAGPASATYRVCRGGGWGDSAEACGIARRGFRSEGRREDLLGFRIALSAVSSAEVPETDKTVEGKVPSLPTNSLAGMVYVKGGNFQMGCPEGAGCRADETPVHRVTVSSFYMGDTEVTCAEYCEFLNAYGSDKVKSGEHSGKVMIVEWEMGLKKTGTLWQPQPGYENHPVVPVTWYGANEYCQWRGGRLPTEAEWEYAARGGEHLKSTAYAGSTNIDEVAWYLGTAAAANTAREDKTGSMVGRQKAPNELGLYDLSGNVWEWCADWYSADFYQHSAAAQDPLCDTGEKKLKVLRGGSWHNDARNCRVFNRGWREPNGYTTIFGFRVVIPAR